MSDVWYRLLEGRTDGPVRLADMQRMADSGVLQAGDLVSQDGSQWRAVSTFPEIRVTAAVPTTVHDLNYPAPAQVATQVTPRVIELLRQTSVWVRIMSVILFVSCGLMVCGGLMMMVGAALGAARRTPFSVGIGAAVYMVIALLYVVPAVLLHRYASYAKAFARLHTEQDLESAMQAQKSFWKYVSLFTLIMMGLYLVAIAVFLVVMLVMRLK